MGTGNPAGVLRVWHVTAHVTGTLTPRPVWEELKSDTRNRNQAAPLTWLFTCFSLIASYLTKRNLLNEIGFHGGVQGHGLVARNQIVFRTGELPAIHGPLLASERRLYCILQAGVGVGGSPRWETAWRWSAICWTEGHVAQSREQLGRTAD